MSQTKKMSLVESVANIAIGFAINVTAQYFIFPLFGMHIPIHENLMIAVIFTVISLARSFTLRRLFNRIK